MLAKAIFIGSVGILTISVRPAPAAAVNAQNEVALAVAQASEKVRRRQFEEAILILEPVWRRVLAEGWFEDSIQRDEAKTWENFLFLRSDYLWQYAFSREPGTDRTAALERAARAHRDYFDFADAEDPTIDSLFQSKFYRNRARSRLKNFAATLYQAGRPEEATSELEAMFVTYPEWFTPEGIRVWLYCLRWEEDTTDLASSRSIQERLRKDSPYRGRWKAFLNCFDEWRNEPVWTRAAEDIEKEVHHVVGDEFTSLVR